MTDAEQWALTMVRDDSRRLRARYRQFVSTVQKLPIIDGADDEAGIRDGDQDVENVRTVAARRYDSDQRPKLLYSPSGSFFTTCAAMGVTNAGLISRASSHAIYRRRNLLLEIDSPWRR